VSSSLAVGGADGSPSDVESIVETVRSELARPPGERPSHFVRLEEQLESSADQLRSTLQDAAKPAPAEAGRRLELLYELGELRGELRSRVLLERLEVLARIQDSMEVLYECETPEELIEAAPAELCRSCGFSRSLISRVRGSMWVPEVYEPVPGGPPEEEPFREWVEHTEIPLEHMLLETEMVRRRMPALVLDPVNDPRTFKEIVVRGRTIGYVAAPIISGDRAIGFLHADRYGQPEPVSDEDKDNIWTFAEHFAFLFDRAVLVERLASQRAQLHEAFGNAEEVLVQLRNAEIEFARGEQSRSDVTATAKFLRAESRLDSLLTRREREVLELITSGATNIRIAERLVISEGTVKSHVKHILRKLRVGNRAEAVARYLQLLKREQL
jgi:DNA-binding CsgD family transcriptional regulator